MPDSMGMLGVIDPSAYHPMVEDHDNWPAVLSHFDLEMGRRTLLLWATGAQDSWSVDVSVSPVDRGGSIRTQARGSIAVTAGRLVLVNSEMLQTIAQCESEDLWEDLNWYDNRFELPDGSYVCTVTMLGNSEDLTEAGRFHLQFEPGEVTVWQEPAWFERWRW
ncbi:hypothetical protein [Nocardia sp. NPDC056000]|uniref:hypothetical protein n=1 Tax=Nocardia sp. NPDC056000 TaxID=3345674 RepID=UPI0035DA3CC1